MNFYSLLGAKRRNQKKHQAKTIPRCSLTISKHECNLEIFQCLLNKEKEFPILRNKNLLEFLLDFFSLEELKVSFYGKMLNTHFEAAVAKVILRRTKEELKILSLEESSKAEKSNLKDLSEKKRIKYKQLLESFKFVIRYCKLVPRFNFLVTLSRCCEIQVFNYSTGIPILVNTFSTVKKFAYKFKILENFEKGNFIGILNLNEVSVYNILTGEIYKTFKIYFVFDVLYYKNDIFVISDSEGQIHFTTKDEHKSFFLEEQSREEFKIKTTNFARTFLCIFINKFKIFVSKINTLILSSPPEEKYLKIKQNSRIIFAQTESDINLFSLTIRGNSNSLQLQKIKKFAFSGSIFCLRKLKLQNSIFAVEKETNNLYILCFILANKSTEFMQVYNKKAEFAYILPSSQKLVIN